MSTFPFTPLDALVIDSPDCKITSVLRIISSCTTFSLLTDKLHEIGNGLCVRSSKFKSLQPIQALENILMDWRYKAEKNDQAKLTTFIRILQQVDLNEMAEALTEKFGSQQFAVESIVNQIQPVHEHSFSHSSVNNAVSTSKNVKYASLQVHININGAESKVKTEINLTEAKLKNLYASSAVDSLSKNSETSESKVNAEVNINCIDEEQKSLMPGAPESQDKPTTSQAPFQTTMKPPVNRPGENRLKKLKTVLTVFLLQIVVIAICIGLYRFIYFYQKPDNPSPRIKHFVFNCSEELYSRPVVPIYANSQLNYSESIKTIPANLSQINMSLYIIDSHHWSPTAEIWGDKEITEAHISGNVCPETILSLLSKTSCAKKLSFVVRLETCKTLTHNKYDNVSLTNLESLKINGAKSNINNRIYAVLAQNVKMEYLTNFTLVNTTINDENLYHIMHILNNSKHLQYFELSGTNLAKEPFYNITFPAMNVKHMVWNQYFADSRKVNGNFLQLNSYFCDKFPNIESFVSEEGYLYYGDRFNLFRCKNITKLWVKIQISTDDTTHIDDIGITSRLANLKRLKLYLQFRDNKCPTFEKINAIGLQNLIDNYSIDALSIKSNCPLLTGWSSYYRG